MHVQIKSACLIFSICFALKSSAQDLNKLKYNHDHFYKMGAFSEHWKNSEHIFKHDANLLNHYNSFFRSKSTSKILAHAAISQIALGFIAFRFIDCDRICYPHLVSGFLFFISGPITGVLHFITKGISTKRKNVLLDAYNSEFSLSSTQPLNLIKLNLSITNSGLSLSVLF